MALWARRRAGRTNRRWARVLRWRFLRTNLRLVVLLAAAWGIASLFLVWLSPDREQSFLAGVLVTCFPWMLALIMCSTSPLGRIANGGLAEEWTSKHLRRITRGRGRVLDDVAFMECNVDHVLVVHDWVVAIETKWTSVPWTPADDLFQVAVEQARYGARKIRLLLASKGIQVAVLPALAVWGPGVGRAGALGRIGEVRVVHSGNLQEWASRLFSGTPQAPDQTGARIVEAIEDFIAERDRFERATGATMKRLIARTR